MKAMVFLLFMLSLFSSNCCQAQKKQKRQTQYIAHYNSEDLKANWKEWQEMELEVEEYQDSLNKIYQLDSLSFQKKIEELKQRINNRGRFDEELIEREYKNLKEQEKQLLQQAATINPQVLVRRESLEGNLLEKLNDALQSLAENKNYTYILDASTIDMCINGGEDLTALLLEGLGD